MSNLEAEAGHYFRYWSLGDARKAKRYIFFVNIWDHIAAGIAGEEFIPDESLFEANAELHRRLK